MPDSHHESPDFIEPAMQRLAQGGSLADFCAWFVEWYADPLLPGARARVGDLADAPAEARRAAGLLARDIWRVAPDPAHGWGPRALPSPGRNDRCFCGSGRKYKQCCLPLAVSLPPVAVEPAAMAGLLFVHGPPAWRAIEALLAMPPDALTSAALTWGEHHGPGGVIELLEGLFLAPARLGARHEAAFDLLMEAMLQLGLDARREQAARVLAGEARNRQLRSTGHCRLAVMLSDRGDLPAAWEHVQAARREEADNPELLHLEMMLLLSQGREEEARARAPFLAARAAKLGYPELAELLPRLAEEGIARALRGLGDDEVTPEEEEWIALLRAPLPFLEADRFGRLHALTKAVGELRIEPVPALQRPLANWRRRFGAAPGMLTSLDGDADALLEDAAAARAWLRAHPDCMVAVPVLDDLLLAARVMVAGSASIAVPRAAADLGFAVADMVLDASRYWPSAPLPWIDTANRPLLRVMAQAVNIALGAGEEERAFDWMRWMLERNPTDNHGWRDLVRIALLRRGDAEAVLALLAAYPDDMPPSEHDRALALYFLQRRDEAEAVLRRTHAAFPAFIAALLPEALDRPPGGEDGMREFGGAAAAWDWRNAVRDLWHSCGALAWLRGLDLPPPPPRRQAAPAGRAKPPRKPKFGDEFLAPHVDPVPVLRRHFGQQFPWLMGWLAGAAWAPSGVNATDWVAKALGRPKEPVDEGAVPELLEALMVQYNRFNHRRLTAKAGAAVPLPITPLGRKRDAAWAGFAAGFVQFAESSAASAWRALGADVAKARGPWAPLRQLAALAPVGPDGWRPLDDRERPLLDVADAGVPAVELLQGALQPLWERTLADARRSGANR